MSDENPWDYWNGNKSNFDMSLIQYQISKEEKIVDFIEDELCKSNEELVEYYKNYVMNEIDYDNNFIKYFVILKKDGVLKMEDEVKMDNVRRKNEKKRLKKKLKKQIKKGSK